MSRWIIRFVIWLLAVTGPIAFAEVEVAAGTDPAVSAEVGALLGDERIQAGLAHIVAMEPRTLADLIDLTEIPAPPFQEHQRAERFAELLRDAGLEAVFIDEAGNVVGRRPGREAMRTVAYSAHLDTVFPAGTDVTVRREGSRLYAPGIGDNSRGLVTVLAVLRAMEHAGIETRADVLFVGNVGEEGLGDLRGVKHLFRADGPGIDTLIAVDGGRSDRIVYGGVGSHRYRVIFRGPGGHSWGAFGTANPLHALGHAIALFVDEASMVTTDGEKSSFNVGRASGGTSVNSIPFEAWAEVDIRSGDQAKIDEIDRLLHFAVDLALEEANTARTEGTAMTAELLRVGTRPAARGDPGSLVVQRAVAATRAFGIEPSLRLSSTDANLPLSLGVPAVTISRGGVSGNTHAPTEWWENVDGHVGIQIALLTLLAEAGLAR